MPERCPAVSPRPHQKECVMEENWKDVPSFEGRYQVSDLGRVRSVDRVVEVRTRWGGVALRNAKGKVLAPGLSRGYLIVNLYPKGTIAVHLLVARAFVENPNGLPEANHADGVKLNCAAGNLEWVTKARNQEHAVDIGLRKQAIAVRSPSGEVYPSIARAAKAVGSYPLKIANEWARA